MALIDLTPGKKTFVVPTTVVREGTAYMGPDVKIQANSATEAQQRVREQGYEPNKYFHPHEVKD